MRDLCDTSARSCDAEGLVCTVLGAYDAEQTNRSSSFFGERGARQKRHPTTMDGLVSPEPRMAGGDLGALAAAHIRWPWMAECPCSQDSNRTFEIRALPRMAKRRNGEKGPCALPRIWGRFHGVC